MANRKPSVVRKILWNFHYNSSYGPARAERDLDRAYTVKRAKMIRWYRGEKSLGGGQWWHGYVAGRLLWQIYYTKHYYCLYDNAYIFFTEKMNGMGFDTMKEAKEVAQYYFDKFYMRATR
jgi:hypothetical protein